MRTRFVFCTVFISASDSASSVGVSTSSVGLYLRDTTSVGLYLRESAIARGYKIDAKCDRIEVEIAVDKWGCCEFNYCYYL